MENSKLKKLSLAHAHFQQHVKNNIDIVVPDCAALIPFNGYYPIAGIPGAFLSLDTTYHYSNSSIFPLNYASMEISFSMDGLTSTMYPFDFDTTFDGTILTIPGVLTLEFIRQYEDGNLVHMSGSINNIPVTGSTNFNPVSLETYAGEYFQVDPPVSPVKLVLDLIDKDTIKFDYGTDSLSPINSYTYNPAMYVLICSDDDGKQYILMLGTAGQYGLAVSVQADNQARMAFSILP